MERFLIIIPTYNEKDNVELMIQRVFELYPSGSILILDDSSPDGTGNKVKELQDKYENLHLIERPSKLGLASAYCDGFSWALERDYQFIVQIDCDFSHDPQDIEALVKACQSSCDLAIGSRYVGGIRIINWPFSRLLLSYGASLYVRLMTGLKAKDPTGGFKCFRREVLEAINLKKIRSKGYSFQVEMNFKTKKLGFRIREVPIIFREREKGASKMSFKIITEAFFMTFALRIFHLLGK